MKKTKKTTKRSRNNVTWADVRRAKNRAGELRVYNLMKDHRWHDRFEIQSVAGEDKSYASEGLRRMRELRKFFTIEKRLKDADKNLYEYRLHR